MKPEKTILQVRSKVKVDEVKKEKRNRKEGVFQN